MTLPNGWINKAITGTYRGSDASVPAGFVYVETQQIIAGDGVTVVPRQFRFPLDADGNFSGTVPVPHYPDLGITGIYYIITERFPGARRPYTIYVAHDDAGIDLATAAPVVPPEDLIGALGAPAVVATEAAKVAAQASAASAGDSASSAEAAKAAALVASSNAIESATRAAAHADNAGVAAGSASDSASVAVAKAGEALTYANAANGAATRAEQSEANTVSKAADAADSAQAADASAAGALDAQSQALAAQVASEAARDDARVSVNIYPTTAAGIAATNATPNKYFSVPSAGTNDYLDLWKNVAGVATPTGKTYPSSSKVASIDTQVQPIAATFDVTPAKNLYNPALAVDASLYNYATGASSVFATSIVSGQVSVQDGKTYTLSQPSPEAGFYPHLYFWNGAGGYLGMDALISGNPVVAGTNLVASSPSGSGGYRTVTFTVPVGSGIAFVGALMLYNYAAHTTADFNRIRNATQLELGTSATAFEAYGTLAKATPKEASMPATIQRSAPVAPVLSAFDVAASRNLYDLSKAVNGQIIGYATGTNSAYADGISLGYFPVAAGQTYTVSMTDPLGFHATHPLYCRDASGAFLGIDHTIGATVGMASPPTGITWIGDGTVTFTIPAGSAIAFIGLMANYSVGHTLADFNRVVGTVQAEVGLAPTGYQPYAPAGIATLKPSAVPPAASPNAVAPLAVTRAGKNIYIRSKFDATYDLVQLVTLATGVAFTNDTVNVMGARKALNTIASTIAAYNGGTVLAAQGDSSAPLNYNGTFIGANHGAFFIREVTAAGHGKVVQDVGSEWTDGAAVKWYLMRVVDANKLWFLSQNNAVYPAWSFVSSLTGNLTHSSGATNTGAITVASSVQTQLWPALQNQTKRVLLDGITDVTADGDYRCATLSVVNAYNIVNPAAALAYVRGMVGGAVQPAFNDPSIAADVRRSLTYRYAENGSCTIVDGVRVLNTLSWASGYFPATQAEPLNFTGKQLWHYVPRLAPIVGGVKTWNFAAQEEIDGTMEQINYTSASWTDANNPPDRSAQIVKTAGVAEFGMMIGVSPVRSVGLPSMRKTLLNDAGFVSAIRKQYCKAVGTLAPITAGSYYETVAFRAFWAASANPDATCFTWYRDGKAVIVVADFHKNVSLSPLVLPQQFVGMDVAIVDKTASASVLGNGVVTADGILVTITGGYGYVVLRLT